MKNRFAMAALTSAAMFLALGAQSAEFEEVKKKRSELMKGLSSENKAMRNAAQEGNMADVEKSARELASQFAMIPDRSLFPEGSGGEDTRAKPAVWENWTEFEQKAETARTVALALAAQAKAGNVEEVKTLARSLGKEACGNCHETFRAPKKKSN